MQSVYSLAPADWATYFASASCILRYLMIKKRTLKLISSIDDRPPPKKKLNDFFPWYASQFFTEVVPGYFTNCWNKAAASQISPDFISLLISDYHSQIVNILIYITKHSKMMQWTMEQEIFCGKTHYETVFQVCSTKMQKGVRCPHISKPESNVLVLREHWSSCH